ncbi:hypothetical protein AAF712_006329 [Marasmius tenuissimus]|uniref:F-box domain-containing protein n=1 Tax=Marasmius tenuissimus TaxID=585030 RepID=A0ABR3A007_9AGAR
MNPSQTNQNHNECRQKLKAHETPTLDPRFRRPDYIPSYIERSELAEILEQCQQEIAVIERSPAMFEEEKRSLEMTAGTCLSALSSQRRVPTEVLEIIFTMFCTVVHDYSFKLDYDDGNGDQNPDDRSISLEMPSLALTHVCSRWRGIATSLPCLWSSLSVNFNELPFDLTVPLGLYLSRSRASPLSLRITRFAGSRLEPLSEVGIAAWQKLASGFRRCRNLSSVVSYFDFPRLQDLSFPKLETVHDEEPHWVEGTNWFWNAIMKSPRLTTVSLHHIRGLFPFTRLRALEMPLVNVYEQCQLLVGLPSSQRLEILTIGSMYHSEWRNRPPLVVDVKVPSLRTLFIGRKTCRNDPICLVGLLLSLSIPSLEYLMLSCSGGWPPSLLTLAARAPLLTTLNLCVHLAEYDRDPSPVICSRCSSIHIPSPASFISDWDSILAGVLSNLRMRPDSSIPLSGLKHVHLHVSQLSLNRRCVDQVLDLISERHSASRALTEFRVSRDPTPRLPGEERAEKIVLDPELQGDVQRIEGQLGVQVHFGEFDRRKYYSEKEEFD